jgi:hypothetical protein
MKRNLFLLCGLGCMTQQTFAANINVGALNQAQFVTFSQDMGAALSYKAAAPDVPLGITGFDVGLEATATQMDMGLVQKAGGPDTGSLIVPRLQVEKGLPFDINIGGFYSAVPASNINLYGGELSYALLSGGLAEPTIAVRGAFTKMSGVTGWGLDTKSLDLSISKGFAILTPYAGLGSVWTNSTATGFSEATFQQAKVFFGANVNLGLANFDLEYDRTGGIPSFTANVGFRW